MLSGAIERGLVAPVAWALLLVLAALPARGQYRVGDDGRARDASNQIGSGGINSTDVTPGRVMGNQVITGNVTGARAFRGNVPYTDAAEFRGITSGTNMDRFIRDSSGVPLAGQTPADLARRVEPYYGESRVGAPPVGFMRLPGTGGYVANPPPVEQRPLDYSVAAAVDAPLVTLPRPGELLLPGPVDPATQAPTLFSASPLYGVRPWSTTETPDQFMISRGATGGLDRPRLNNVDLLRMRQELNSTIVPPAQDNEGKTPAGMIEGLPPGMLPSAVSNQPLSGAVGSLPLASGLDTGQSLRSTLMVPPEKQSAQYAELRRRLERQSSDRPMTDEEANRQFRALKRAAEEGSTAVGPTTPLIPPVPVPHERPGPATRRGDGIKPLPPLVTPIPSPKPPPLEIKSLADGVQAQGLRDLLKSAEDLMREGKFTSALETYDAAAKVAPNNPLIPLGRAHAELGATYYQRAEAHLRQAFKADEALLLARYDLKGFYGEQRLQLVIDELKDVADKEPNAVRPVLLLAYIHYNVHDPARAAGFLDLAAKRAGGAEELVTLMRKHWVLGR